MERVSRSIGEGDLTNFIKLRPKDELKDLADAMNEMTMGLRTRVTNIRDASQKLQNGLSRMKAGGKIDAEVLEAATLIETSCKSFLLEREMVAAETAVSTAKEEEDEKEEKA